MSVQASQFGDELRIVKGEVAEVNRLISRLQSEIEAVKAQVQILTNTNINIVIESVKRLTVSPFNSVVSCHYQDFIFLLVLPETLKFLFQFAPDVLLLLFCAINQSSCFLSFFIYFYKCLVSHSVKCSVEATRSC